MKTPKFRRFSRLFSVLVIAFFCAVMIFADNAAAQKKDLRQIRREVEREYLASSSKKIERHSGDFRLRSTGTVDADLVITDGNVTIDGTVRGSVIVIDGDLEVGKRGEIRGDAIAISGNIIRESGSIIVGDEIQRSWRSFVERRTTVRRRWDRQERSSRYYRDIGFDFDDDLFDDDSVLFRYNRVEGLFLGYNFERDGYWDDPTLFHIYGNGGYGLKSKEWRFLAGMERNFFHDNSPSIGVKIYDLTDSDDFWRIHEDENTLAALFIKEDFIDYYNRRGITGYFEQNVENVFKFNVEYRSDTYYSMYNKTNWSFFGGNKRFALNRPVTEGDMKSVFARISVDTRRSSRYMNQGWYLNLETEVSNPDIGGDFDFERYIVEIRRYQPLSRYENINLRVFAGSSKNTLPIQRRFYLGGLSTLRAFDYKVFEGSSMLLGNAEYVFDPSRIFSGPPIFILEDFKMAGFFDIGAVTDADIDGFMDSFENIDFKHNAGVGLMTHDEDFRIDFAWRTDQKGDDLRVTFRLKHAF